MHRLVLSILLISLSPLCFASSTGISMEDLRMQKRFGIGVGIAGGLSVLGLEVEINLTDSVSLMGGLGTGSDYSTFALKAKYALLGRTVSPYFALGFGRWWSGGTRERNIGPSVLANKFLDPGADLREGFSVFMAYPAFGVQFLHSMGLSFYAEVQYLFKLMSFANGTYAGAGVSWFF